MSEKETIARSVTDVDVGSGALLGSSGPPKIHSDEFIHSRMTREELPQPCYEFIGSRVGRTVFSRQLDAFHNGQTVGENVVDPTEERDRILSGHDEHRCPESFEPLWVIAVIRECS